MKTVDDLMALAQVWVDLHTVPGHGEDSRAALRYAIEQALSDSDRDYADMRRFQGLYIAADQELRALKAEPAPELPMDALELAILFHHTYERLAPNVGYDTRVETRIFDPESPNGKLMVAVCAEILPLLKAEQALEPVAWIQPDHLQKARVAPFLCRVEPTKRMSDFIPIYTEQVTHGLQMECPASATDDSGSADGVGARCVDAAVMEHAARPLKAEPAPEPLTDAQVYEIWERAAQIDLSGRVNELIRTKDAQCVIRAVLKAQKEKT